MGWVVGGGKPDLQDLPGAELVEGGEAEAVGIRVAVGSSGRRRTHGWTVPIVVNIETSIVIVSGIEMIASVCEILRIDVASVSIGRLNEELAPAYHTSVLV